MGLSRGKPRKSASISISNGQDTPNDPFVNESFRLMSFYIPSDAVGASINVLSADTLAGTYTQAYYDDGNPVTASFTIGSPLIPKGDLAIALASMRYFKFQTNIPQTAPTGITIPAKFLE